MNMKAKMQMTKSIILLSGGLDSLVSLGLTKEKLNVELALTFDYGQKSASNEIMASSKICEYYDIKHKVIKLDFLKEITQTALVSDKLLPSGELLDDEVQSAKSVWVPNRNGLFLNIAGCFADSYKYVNIIIGANKEEAKTFPDNTLEFIESVNCEFEFSSLVHPKVIAPLINYTKNDIVMLALSNNIPLEPAMSCYQGGARHCGVCESCVRLRQALEANHANEYIAILFG